MRRRVDGAHQDVPTTAHRAPRAARSLTVALLEAETLDMVDAYAAAMLPAHVEAEEPLGARAPGGAAAAHFKART